MDPRNQIEATLTRDALKRYRSEFPDRELSKHGTKGYPMTLLDFEIVFEYSASKPEVHFYVKDFRIDWGHGRRSASFPKKITNDCRVFELLQAAFRAAKELHEGGDSPILADGNQSDASVSSQGNIRLRQRASREVHPDSGISQEAFASQVPTAPQPAASNVIPTSDHEPLRKTAELLVHLGRCPKGLEGDTTASVNHMDRQGVNLQSSPRPAAEHKGQQLYNNRQGSKGVDDPLGLVDDQARRPATAPEIMPSCAATIDAGSRDFNSSADVEPSTAKIETGKDVNGAAAMQESQEFANEEPNTNRRDVEDTELRIDMGTFKRTETASSHNRLNQGYPGPWDGMTRIRTRDIRIPEEQKCLLESKRLWVPPPPGMDLPRGHVPPLLLDRWNKVAAQMNSFTQKRQSDRTGSGTPNCDIPPSRSPSSQSDSERSQFSNWTATPPPCDPRNELPPDSSPVRARALRQTKSPSANKDNADESPLPRDIGRGTVGNVGEDHHRVEHEDALENDAPGDSSQLNNDLMAVIAPEPGKKACAERPGHESDDESDSVMDTSIPCPLGGATQQMQHTSQSEKNHSCPSIPDPVQVMQTPAANIARLRSNGVTTNRGSSTKDGGRSSQERSSQAGKWSSQSRVVDTYGGNQHEGKGCRSQSRGTTISSVDEAGSIIDVMGTQEASGVNQPAYQSTPHSQHGVFLDSSEARIRDESASVWSSTPQAVSSQPFSSSREAPFSQADGDSRGLSIYSSSKETHPQDGFDKSQVPPLKRSAAEVEDGHPSSKRHKSAIQENDLLRKRAVGGDRNSDTPTRRQSYIIGSSELAGAVRAHEKFRSDYPSYSGDFAHFIELCHKLQCLRSGGKLTKSFLWDDFIIMHLQEYPGYLERCRAADAKSWDYEEYFTSTFSRALHKRRSLTASAIELGAAQYAPVAQPSRPAGLTPVRDGGDISSVHSPVNEPSHSRAHSHGTPPSGPIGADADHLPPTNLSQAHRNHDTPVDERESNQVEKLSSSVRKGPPTLFFENTGPEVNQESERGFGGSESDERDADVKMEEAHDTASIELGDDENPPSSPYEGPNNELEGSNETEGINENWFVSLRHIRPTGPVWSDDRNTPFKTWARADLNVKSERALRDWRYLSVDDRGVVQRTITSPDDHNEAARAASLHVQWYQLL